MPGERNSLYSRLLRNYMRRPGGTSRRLGGQIGGFNTGRNQGPQGRDVASVLRAAVGNMGRVNRMRQRNPNRDWRTGHPMRRRRMTRIPGEVGRGSRIREVAGRSSAGGIRP